MSARPFPLPAPEPPRPQQVPPQPVPTVITVGQAPANDGTTFVVVQFQTPVGVAIYFLDPDAACRVGGQIRQMGKAGRSGLTLPPGVGLNGHDDDEPAPVADMA